MIEFLKENVIFFISSILLVGLFVFVSELRKTPPPPSLDQTTSTSTITDTTEPQIVPDIIIPPVEIKNTTPKVSNPAPAPVIKTPTRHRSDDNEEDFE